MTSATRLTEAEKIELEGESLWERIGASSEWESMWERIGASVCKIQREQEVKFDALKKAILDLSLPSKGRLMATTDANSGSYCSTDFEQLECNLSPVQKTEELELPHVEGPRSHNLESHERGWDVQRSTAATNEHSDSRESHVRAGEVHRSCNNTDHDPLEVVPTPWQETEELEPSMPLPHNWNLEKVNGIDSEPYVLSSSLESKDYLRVENSRKESVEFGAQNQGILILPPARENAQLKELVVSLPTPVYYNFASKWLLECDHKPKVKMKCRVDCVEFYSKFSHNCNSVSLGLLWRCASKLEAGISLVTSIFSKDYFSEIFDIGSSRHGMDHIGGLVEQHSNVVEEESTMSMKNILAFSGKEFGSFRGFSQHLDVDGFMESPNLLGQEVIEFKASFDSVRKWKNLSNWEKLGNKRCELKLGAKVDNLGILAKLRGLGGNCWEVMDLLKESEEALERISAVVFYESGVESSKWWSLSERLQRSLGYDHWGNIKENEDFFLFALLFCQQESSTLMAIKESSKMVSLDGDFFACQRIDGKYVERDERASTLERTEVYIVEGDIDDVSRLEKLFELVSFTHVMHLVSHVGVRYAMENPSYYEHSNIAGLVYVLEIHKVAKPQPSIVWDSISSMTGLNTKVLFSERNGADQPTSLYDAAKRAGFGLWGKLEMAYFFFTSDILKGNSIPIFEAATYETAAVGKSTGCSGKKRIHQLTDIGWMVSVLFPKPRVKMKVWEDKHKKLGSMIPRGQGILRGRDCCKHKLSYAEVVKERFPWFLEDKEP